MRTFSRLDYPIRTMSFSHDGSLLASASEDLVIDVAHVETGAPILQIQVRVRFYFAHSVRVVSVLTGLLRSVQRQPTRWRGTRSRTCWRMPATSATSTNTIRELCVCGASLPRARSVRATREYLQTVLYKETLCETSRVGLDCIVLIVATRSAGN